MISLLSLDGRQGLVSELSLSLSLFLSLSSSLYAHFLSSPPPPSLQPSQHVYNFPFTDNNFNPLGAAGVAGALIYAGLTFLISPKATLLIQLFMPLVMLVTYLFILGKPRKILPSEVKGDGRHIQDPHVPPPLPQTSTDPLAPPPYSKLPPTRRW